MNRTPERDGCRVLSAFLPFRQRCIVHSQRFVSLFGAKSDTFYRLGAVAVADVFAHTSVFLAVFRELFETFPPVSAL